MLTEPSHAHTDISICLTSFSDSGVFTGRITAFFPPSYPFHGEGSPGVVGEEVHKVVVGRKNGDDDSCEYREKPKHLASQCGCLNPIFFQGSEFIVLKGRDLFFSEGNTRMKM